MIINNAPQNEATVSNVAEVGEFRIRNSAKAFSILSSGLYSNKICAIVRELSCNAVDSHVAAGKKDVPFDLHLPNTLEPWFSIRDYGTGLSHEQVINIYTTYFESTKTSSNEFIGALGLGSKSPFAYTDNFTVTAVKDQRKGIYTAFINQNGIPSIALMMEEETNDPNGVEVKFSVNDRWDFETFKQEAKNIYRYFDIKPLVNDNAFTFNTVEYESENIIPGVHTVKNARYGESVAVMGNIAYPIQIPHSDQTLGDYAKMLRCSLEMHFNIGELDFQASREALSYDPRTLQSIKEKLINLSLKLSEHLASEADAIENLWDRAFFLMERSRNDLWTTAVDHYVKNTNFSLVEASGSFHKVKTLNLSAKALRRKLNLEITGYSKTENKKTLSSKSVKLESRYNKKFQSVGARSYIWSITPRKDALFIINDLNKGIAQRVKHFANTELEDESAEIYILHRADVNKPAQINKFFTGIFNPSSDYIMKASELPEVPKKQAKNIGKNVTVLSLTEKRTSSWRSDYTWSDAGKADTFDQSKTYYYLPLSGYIVQSVTGREIDVKALQYRMLKCGIKDLSSIRIYGVRKGDLDYIKAQPNWINLETHISSILTNINTNLLMGLVMSKLDRDEHLKYHSSLETLITNTNSPFLKFVLQFKGFEKVDSNWESLNLLLKDYGNGTTVDPTVLINKITNERSAVLNRYRLLDTINYRANLEDIAEYINMVDTTKGI